MNPSQATSIVEDDPIRADLERLSRTSPQCSFIDFRPKAPEATSTLYIRRFSTQSVKDGPKDHTVTGVHIVLAKGHENKLWEAFHVDRSTQTIDPKNPKVAVGSLRIYCDTLEVHGAFSLPEADVDIFARRLIWADQDASIDTSPLPWTLKPRDAVRGIKNETEDIPAEDGAHGRTAGSIRIFAQNVEPSDPTKIRLIARGGDGQDGGRGEHMHLVEKIEIWHGELPNGKGIVDFFDSAQKKPRASHYQTFSTRKGGGFDTYPEWIWGNKHHLPPGKPGDGGNGGSLTTNFRGNLENLTNRGGSAGIQHDPTGQTKGPHWSVAYGHYRIDLRIYMTPQYPNQRYAEPYLLTQLTDSAVIHSSPGKDGSSPDPVFRDIPNAWVHPHGMQTVLEYVRDMFLAGAQGQLRNMLSIYRQALSQSRPDTGAWDGVESEWEAARTEIATLLLRDQAHLDYFGNPAGYSPLLSLAGSIQLYKDEAGRALRMMLISKRIRAADRSAREASDILEDTIGAVNADTEAAAAQVNTGRQKIEQTTRSLKELESELEGLAAELIGVRNKLLAQAQADLKRKARIKSFFKLAGALCQVIPVGQPVLGSLGSLAAVASDFAGDDWETAPATIGKIGPVLKKGGNALAEAQKVADKAGEETSKTPRNWSRIGESLESAFSLGSESLKALQVPKTEVEAALAKLQAESPEWKNLCEKIEVANKKKVALFADLQEVMHLVGEGYSRLAANAGTVVRLEKQRNQKMASLDAEAVAAVQHMEQRSRRSLQEYLYLVVKSYEASRLTQPTVDWRLPAVTNKIDDLVSPAEEWDAAKLNANAEALDTVFQNTLADIRKQLLKGYQATAVSKRPFTLLADQTPREIEALNSKTRRVVIDPLEAGLIDPDQQFARLRSVTLDGIVLDRKWSEAPKGFQMRLELVPARKGIMRRGSELYAISSESPSRWGWTCSRQAGEDPRIEADTRSPANDDILDIIVGPGGEKIREKLSLVPAWSDLTLSVKFPPNLRASQRPKITELLFTIEIDSGPAPTNQKVLTVRPEGGVGDEVITCSPEDGAGRVDGHGPMVRIYTEGAKVKLQAQTGSGKAEFDRWETTEEEMDPGASSLQIELENHVMAWPRWTTPAPEKPARVPAQARPGQAGAPQAIRVEPDTASAVIGLVPRWGEATVLEHGTGWDLVNYRGVTGWIATT
ncbi:SH3 domain-containing protein [Nocardiopsis sp. NPDC006139]|uniref:SH3 domain-containing protein n=1 Tax=Nocardiopsis sp. NPDC006139 TaxID=3154578 RepID=UPI0033A677EE